MRLSTKLIFMTFLLLLAFAGLGYFSIVQLHVVNQKSNEISSKWLPSTVNVQRINTLTSDYRIYEISYIYSVDAKDIKKYKQLMANVLHELAVVRKNYEAFISCEEESYTYKRFSILWEKYLQISEKILDYSQSRNLTLATEYLENESRELFDAASSELLMAVNFNREQGVEVSRESDKVYLHSLDLIYLSILVVILLAACICGYVILSIQEQLGKDPKELIKLSERVIAGDYNVIEDDSHIGVYKHILTMVRSLKHHIENANKSAQIKSEFLANMSHEIRTPMNGILGLLYLISKTELNGKQEDYIQKTLLSAQNLLRIIDDILDFSKMEAGKLELEHIPFTLSSIQAEINHLYGPKAKEKNLHLTITTEHCAETQLLGDPLRIKQVLFNFVSNALKFTEQGGIEITMQCTEQNSQSVQCLFSVQDSGIGLNAEQQEKLFSAFTQADSSFTRKYGGTGLGLVISKNIVESLGGTISIQSAKGKGSTFSFTLTLEIDKTQAISTSTHETSAVLTENQRHGHLLLVEDNEINQIIAQELLESVGYTIDVAVNGQEALEMLDKKSYVAVLMDIQMPVMDGLTAARKIRQSPKYKNLIVIAMSAHALEKDRELSIESGMNEHITKPIDPQVLFSTLDKWLGNS